MVEKSSMTLISGRIQRRAPPQLLLRSFSGSTLRQGVDGSHGLLCLCGDTKGVCQTGSGVGIRDVQRD